MWRSLVFQATPHPFSRQFKPCLKFVLGDLSCLASGLHLSGGFAPGIELIRREFSCLHSGEPFFVLPAIFIEHIIAFLAERPLGDSTHFLAGAAPAVKRTVTIFRRSTTCYSKISAAVFALPHFHLSLGTLAEMIVDHIVNRSSKLQQSTPRPSW